LLCLCLLSSLRSSFTCEGGGGSFCDKETVSQLFVPICSKDCDFDSKAPPVFGEYHRIPSLSNLVVPSIHNQEIIGVRVVTNMLCLLHLQLPGRVIFGERMVYGSCRDVQLLKRVILHWRFTKDEAL
jgi:hypothetical protein